MAKSKFKYFRMDAKRILTDPALSTLKLTGSWTNLLAVCKVCNTNGVYIDELDRIMTLKSIAKLAKLSPKVFKYFQNRGMIVQNLVGEYSVKNWEKYQDYYDRRNPESKVKPPEKPAPNRIAVPFDDSKSKQIPDPPNNPAPKPTPSASPQAVFVDWFKSAYQSRHGKPYADTKADYIQMAPVLKSFNNNFEMLKQLVEAGWNTPDEKNGYSIAGQCMTVKGFCSVVNKIVLQKSKPKTAYELEMEAKR